MRPTLANWAHEPNRGYGEEDLPPELWAAQTEARALDDKFRVRRDQRRAEHPIPDILYHYTDVHGLEGMLKNFTMWLSDAAFMNDPLEGTWVHHRASALAKEVMGDSALAAQTLEQIDAQLAAPDLWDESIRTEAEPSPLSWAAMDEAFRPAFIASFTEAGDLLSQWRGYGAGGSGVSIGFDLKKLDLSLVEHAPERKVRPKVIRVEYNQETQDREISWIMNEAKKVYDKHIEVLTSNSDAADYFTKCLYHPLRDAFYDMKWEFKSPHYSEEREWRIVVNPVIIRHGLTRVSNGHIVPYMEMPLPQTASKPINRLAIEHIVLGPRCQPLVIRGIRGLLTNLCYPLVERSKLALR